DGPSTTEMLTIEVPGGKDAEGNYLAYPWNPEGEAFWYGLDEHEVTVPAASVINNVFHLTFSGEYDPETGTKSPNEEFIAALDQAVTNGGGKVTIVLPEGEFNMSDSIGVDMSLYPTITDLTLQGHGIDKTILNYVGSTGNDSVFVNTGKNLEVSHFSVIDSKKNAIYITESDGVYIHHVGTIWPGEPDQGNGAYGLYPVESENVIVEDSFAFGSADAGIYVGQTNNILVRRTFAVQNVAGIEIENSDNADVYDNYAYMNTGGLLIFDLEIGNGRYGYGTRLFGNVAVSNNEENFAASGVVGTVPPGTGVLLLASEGVEVFDNDISGNETFAVAAVSFFMLNQNVADYFNPTKKVGIAVADGWRPTLREINIRDNRISNTGTKPRGDLLTSPLIAGNDDSAILPAFMGLNGYLPAIVTDGLGQNLANTGVLEALGEPAYAADGSDNLCVDPEQNVSVGTVIEHTGAIPAAADIEAAAIFEIDHNGSYLFNCENKLASLPVYTVTFRGVEMGCGADDNSQVCADSMPSEE
ncbi:MAG: right-handed parallel beta-helix repeat-containing protein, partial [Gammaproteobacteria bacterium]|nr:right-handed parallel beta-helix repeat-containing protein [Gammaproteobacteria bacterium]